MVYNDLMAMLAKADQDPSGAGFSVKLLLRSGVIAEITPTGWTDDLALFADGVVHLDAVDMAWIEWAPGADSLHPLPTVLTVIEVQE